MQPSIARRRADSRPLKYREVASPVGTLLLAGDGEALQYLLFVGGRDGFRPNEGSRADPNAFGGVVEQLRRYFEGALREFDVPLAPQGTDFQLAVWRELRRIPFGATLSYGELARRIHRPGASRAVGAANGANPISIIVPCHRVIGADGSLTGFGGGLAAKQFLLDHERTLGTQRSLF